MSHVSYFPTSHVATTTCDITCRYGPSIDKYLNTSATRFHVAYMDFNEFQCRRTVLEDQEPQGSIVVHILPGFILVRDKI